MIIDGGAEHLAKQAFYKVGKSAVALRLAYTLHTAAPEAGRIFFSRELPKTIEVFDNAAGRYIKCNPATGESLVGRIEGVEGKTITFEKLETNPALVGQSDKAIAKELQVTAESVAKTGGKVDLIAEEALGGHSIARHGPQLSLTEMEQRVLGTPQPYPSQDLL